VKMKAKHVLFACLSLVLCGCRSFTIPISPDAIETDPRLYGLWSSQQGMFVDIRQDGNNRYKIMLNRGSDSETEFVALPAVIGGMHFLSLQVIKSKNPFLEPLKYCYAYLSYRFINERKLEFQFVDSDTLPSNIVSPTGMRTEVRRRLESGCLFERKLFFLSKNGAGY